MPARHASRGGQSQPATHHGCNPQNFPCGDSLQFQVAANAASRIKEVPQRYSSRVEARLTIRTTPGNYTRGAEQIFRNGPPPRSPASPALTRWTVHRKILVGPLRKMIEEVACFGKRLSPQSHLTTYNRNRHGRLHSRPCPRGHRSKITQA